MREEERDFFSRGKKWFSEKCQKLNCDPFLNFFKNEHQFFLVKQNTTKYFVLKLIRTCNIFSIESVDHFNFVLDLVIFLFQFEFKI